MVKDVSKEIVDIGREAEDLGTFSEGRLQHLDQHNKVRFRWHKAKVILWLSAGTISIILIASLATLAFSSDETSRDWARQTLTALMGFGAGAIWTSSQRPNEEEG
jgi:hypothetical protein